MTYCLIGRVPVTGEIGVAVQSKFPGVGTIVLHGRAGAGCVATQAFANPDHGSIGLDLLERGASAAEALAILLRGDEAIDERQIAVLAPDGAPAVHTGAAVRGWEGWAGSATSSHSVAHGNTLANGEVVERMVAAFEAASGEITRRLIAGLRAGRDAGGELRGLQSAAVLVVKPGGGYGGRTGRHVDISVYDHQTPIEELARCYRLHRLSYFPSDPADLRPIDGPLARELKAVLRRNGFEGMDESGDWKNGDIAAMKRFMGVENYDNRIRDDAMIDQEVLDDIRARHGAASPESRAAVGEND